VRARPLRVPCGYVPAALRVGLHYASLRISHTASITAASDERPFPSAEIVSGASKDAHTGPLQPVAPQP
jgi:hypothetical protein